jgi:tRNA nucleotidyltransferase (CCA-adding enzyme)
LGYIAQTKLGERIDFPENASKSKRSFSDPVVIIDPANHENNVASRITSAEKEKIAQAAHQAWETAHYASVQDDEEVWKEIFGNRFKIKD